MNNVLFRILRGFCGLTQTELGAILDREQSSIAKYEIGTMKITGEVAEHMYELVGEIGITEFDILLVEQLIITSANAKKVGGTL